ncbi:MAG: N-succinylarginine dihydrolase [Gammaproteobacteria bacterium]|nr:N-succinylarginine dihydrolase [Gammaproteobacteria bacterium]
MSDFNCFEVNFDGLVGQTHNYAGLSFGNVASSDNGGLTSSPKAAALQGLEKMMALHRLGLKQAVIPPQERPHIPTLKKLGFSGNSDAEIIAKASRAEPYVLASVCSASSMWVANAATISPFPDSSDGKTHITPANLNSMFHRSIEVETTTRILNSIFSTDSFVVHDPLPSCSIYGDEGAANHTRFCEEYGDTGVELFVYGSSKVGPTFAPGKFPARQKRESCEVIARSHGLTSRNTIFAQQNPNAIDRGVFHNDVIAVGNRNLWFYHQEAFLNNEEVCRQLNAAFGGAGLTLIEVPSNRISLENAISSYLFNSQLVSVPGQEGTTIIVPIECQENSEVNDYLSLLEAEHAAINHVEYFDLRQSMKNGGGPACLRLRVVMTDEQIAGCKANVFLSEGLYRDLKRWIEKHYRESLAPEQLTDPALVEECRLALDELSELLNLGSVYHFQLS